MKYTLLIFFLFLLACNGKEPETVVIEVSDTTQTEKIRTFAAKLPDQPYIVTESKDTIIFSVKDTTVSKTQSVTITTTYPVTKVETRPYKGIPVPPVEPPPPTSVSKILTLPKGTAQTYSNRTNLVIENLYFDNKNPGFQNGNVLWFNNCSNITIRNCYFGASAGAAIYAYQSSNIKIENVLIAYTKGAVIVSRSTGGIALNNVQYVNGYGSGDGDGKDGCLYKLIESNGPGFAVTNCRVENFPGESNPEDLVSMYKSGGVQASPINISGNIFRGGGPSQSGGGIVPGDEGGQWYTITNNTLYNPGQYGIGIASGTNITITGNKIYSDRFAWSNNPLFVWNQYATPCNNIVVRNNRANWTDRTGAKNPGWNAGNCSNTVFEMPTTITAAEMGIPAHIITMVTPDELLKIRKKEI